MTSSVTNTLSKKILRDGEETAVKLHAYVKQTVNSRAHAPTCDVLCGKYRKSLCDRRCNAKQCTVL